MSKEEANPRGRPTKYKEEFCELVHNYCLLGATNEDLAKFLCVGLSSIDKWIREKPKFSSAVKSGREEADAQVAKSLFKRATGFSCKETKTASHEGRITDTMDIDKHYPPDVNAQTFWLRNRRPDLWREKQEIESTNKTEMVISSETQDKIIEASKAVANIEAPEGSKDK